MKTIFKLTLSFMIAGLLLGCSTRKENGDMSNPESQADSVRNVAPTSDGMPTNGSTPANAGSAPDSAAQSNDSTSNH